MNKSFAAKILWLAAALCVAGCATNRVDWNSRVGVFTYDQAVTELGPPDKQAKLTDGVVVAEWLTHRGFSETYGAYGYGYPRWFYGPTYPGYVETYSPDYFLRLIFGADGQLQDWKKFTR